MRNSLCNTDKWGKFHCLLKIENYLYLLLMTVTDFIPVKRQDKKWKVSNNSVLII